MGSVVGFRGVLGLFECVCWSVDGHALLADDGVSDYW